MIYIKNYLSLKMKDVNYNILNKLILITGAEGQLGSSLHMNLSQSFNVIPTSKREILDVIKLDVNDKNNIKDVFKKYNPDIIINCAAITDVDYCEINRSECRSINTVGVENIIKYSNKNTKIIQISTDYVYDGHDGPYKETDPTHPLNFYGKTKLEAENILVGSNRKYLIIRLNGLYTFDLRFNNFIVWLYKELEKKNQLKIVNDQISNPTYIELLTNIIFKSILMNAEGIFNYGSNNCISRYEFALEFCEIFNFSSKLIEPVTTDCLSQVAKRPLHTGLITNKIEQQLGLATYNTSYCLNKLKRN